FVPDSIGIPPVLARLKVPACPPLPPEPAWSAMNLGNGLGLPRPGLERDGAARARKEDPGAEEPKHTPPKPLSRHRGFEGAHQHRRRRRAPSCLSHLPSVWGWAADPEQELYSPDLLEGGHGLRKARARIFRC